MKGERFYKSRNSKIFYIIVLIGFGVYRFNGGINIGGFNIGGMTNSEIEEFTIQIKEDFNYCFKQDSTLSKIPDGKLLVWADQQIKSSLKGREAKTPRQQIKLSKRVHSEVLKSCLNNLKNGKMTAETLIAKLPKHLKTRDYMDKFRQLEEEAKNKRAAEELINKPRRKPPGM
ncbi:hypothetical protein N8203_01735 [Crocinitomicaceae bacterium]|nr:hypothetical protein [Crocinitomicaceae bacterium]